MIEKDVNKILTETIEILEEIQKQVDAETLTMKEVRELKQTLREIESTPIIRWYRKNESKN